jgi:hypothetical protein
MFSTAGIFKSPVARSHINHVRQTSGTSVVVILTFNDFSVTIYNYMNIKVCPSKIVENLQ